MKYLSLLFLFIILGCSTNNLETNSKQESTMLTESDSLKVTKIVGDFFDAFDERDLIRMEQLLTPQSIIIHSNGVATDTEEMIEVIKGTKNWHPRNRRLTDFKVFGSENFAVVGLINEVTFSLPEGREVYEPYNETWIFQKNEKNNWSPIRIHYSKIIRDEHTEEVE